MMDNVHQIYWYVQQDGYTVVNSKIYKIQNPFFIVYYLTELKKYSVKYDDMKNLENNIVK